ncbi:hypothetical protein BJ166DRAFT_521590 [Pestalotiopsis sp. NC0098]|nr:hypothetical protein BJ166DRAFT_521590 [Pestalotiopsis sp. NC0098]
MFFNTWGLFGAVLCPSLSKPKAVDRTDSDTCCESRAAVKKIQPDVCAISRSDAISKYTEPRFDTFEKPSMTHNGIRKTCVHL